MKIKARREREKVEFKQAILEAARSLAAEHGWENVSIRKIADRIEYSPPMIYEYFTDKEALLRALLDIGFQQLNARMRAVIVNEPDLSIALHAIAGAYWDYAFANPEMFKVMNGLDGAITGPFTLENKPVEMVKGMQIVSEAIQRWAYGQRLVPPNTESAFLIFWSSINGLVLLILTGRVHLEDTLGYALVQEQVRVLLTGWTVLWSADHHAL